jgi:hypothetical protein
MPILRFGFQDMLDEVSSFSELAKKFIAPGSLGVLSRFHGQLETYRNSTNQLAMDWEIPESNPLVTIPAKEYEPGGHGTKVMIGEITAKWRIKREAPRKKRLPAKFFGLIGLASTRVRLKYPATVDAPEKEIAMWRMEIADDKAPGCYFHTQILGQTEDLPFPSSLPVPRLPAIMMTPAAVAEFVLAELFQDRWGPHAAGQVPHLNRWAPIQRQRFERLLDWKIKQLNKTSGSPWSSLKAAQPHPDLFLEPDEHD